MAPLLLIALLTALPEVVLSLADAGLAGSRLWRPTAYQYGAFWSGLLRDWRPNYALQPLAMFLSYALLHAGLGHLLGNLAGLAWLGPPLRDRVGTGRFLLAWVVAALGGALAFGLLDRGASPMVGASGSIFGLAGAAVALGWRDRRRAGADPWEALAPALGMVLLLVAANLVTWWIEDGVVAWQAHLGGALAGLALGLRWGGYRPLLAKRRS